MEREGRKRPQIWKIWSQKIWSQKCQQLGKISSSHECRQHGEI
jgi:hypothetical protein